MRSAMKYTVPAPSKNTHHNFSHKTLTTPTTTLPAHTRTPFCTAGRHAGLTLLSHDTFVDSYKTQRDIPALSGTSHLSPHHKFGTISIRETYQKACAHHGEGAQQFIAELYWRDFYYHIAYHFPYVFGKSFLSWGDTIAWRDDPTSLSAWKRGETGIPIVDAGMRELNATGWMHNRVRMIVASFLTKNLLIDWREGERYFAQQLVDYDPAVNNGGWQWSASVGADPRPLRIFNPYTQAQKCLNYVPFPHTSSWTTRSATSLSLHPPTPHPSSRAVSPTTVHGRHGRRQSESRSKCGADTFMLQCEKLKKYDTTYCNRRRKTTLYCVALQ
jgi:deoxyribodipyrimidine photo-lyase